MKHLLALLALAGALFAGSASAQLSTPTCPGTPNALGTASPPITALPYQVTFNDVCLLKIFNSSVSGVVNIPAPGTGGNFGKNFPLSLWNEGAGALTLTPQLSSSGFLPTINGAATITLAQGQGADLAIGTDGNWYANTGTSSSGGSTASFFDGTGTNPFRVSGTTIVDSSRNATFNTLTSTVATGTAPLTVTSTTNVANLNASSLNGSVIGTSGATIPLLNGANTWSATNGFAAITATTFNGNTFATGTGSISLGLGGGIFIDPQVTATGGMSIGVNNGVPGSESIHIGLNAGKLQAGGTGGNTLVGQSVLFSNSTAGSSSVVGNDGYKFYTGNQAVTGLGSGAFKNIVACGNCVVVGDSAGLNWTTNAGTSNENTIVGGNGTFAGTAGNGILKDNTIFGAHIAVNATVGAQHNLFAGDNMMNGVFRSGSNNIALCTTACDTQNAATGNYITVNDALVGYAGLPTLVSGFSASTPGAVISGKGTFKFDVTIGATTPGSTGVLAMPDSSFNGWSCDATDITTVSATVFKTQQTGGTSRNVTLTNFAAAGTPAAWVAGDVLQVKCWGY